VRKCVSQSGFSCSESCVEPGLLGLLEWTDRLTNWLNACGPSAFVFRRATRIAYRRQLNKMPPRLFCALSTNTVVENAEYPAEISFALHYTWRPIKDSTTTTIRITRNN